MSNPYSDGGLGFAPSGGSSSSGDLGSSLTSGSRQYPTLVAGTYLRQPGGTFRATPEGLGSAREKYVGLYTDFVAGRVLTDARGGPGNVSRAYKFAHPDFPTLLYFEGTVTRGKGGLATLECEYRGLDPGLSQIPPPIYTLDRTTGNEPLITHPKWSTKIAGTPTTPLNGARFVDGNNLYKPAVAGQSGTFDPTSATFKDWIAGSIMEGRDDYLAPGSVFIKTYTSFSSPSDLSKVGTFYNIDGAAPTPPDGYDWFFLGEKSTDEAGLFRNDASCKLVPTDAGTQIIYGP